MKKEFYNKTPSCEERIKKELRIVRYCSVHPDHAEPSSSCSSIGHTAIAVGERGDDTALAACTSILYRVCYDPPTMNTPVREGQTIEGSRINHAESTLSGAQVLKKRIKVPDAVHGDAEPACCRLARQPLNQPQLPYSQHFVAACSWRAVAAVEVGPDSTTSARR